MAKAKRDLDPSFEPYERQPGEPEKAWTAFCAYRDLGEMRTLRLAAQAYCKIYAMDGTQETPAYVYLRKLATDWHWRERIEAWSREQDRIIRQEELRGKREMYRRQIERSLQHQDLYHNELMKIKKLSDANPDESILKPKVASDGYIAEIKEERINRGEPDTITEERNRVSLVEDPQEIVRGWLADDETAEAVSLLLDKANGSKKPA